jgi:quinol monooxygenase YgiN
MIHVVAIITTKPGLRAQVLEAFNANRPAVLAEQGCISYEATVDSPAFPPSRGSFGEDTFVVLERWESADALKAHGASPHMAEYAAKTREMVASRTLHFLEAA